jgi:ubiquinone/menaquinone biosynthesis C-methylase UbiE
VVSEDWFEDRRTSFQSVTADYDETRPDYPVDGIVWALAEEPRTVLDLGCGPGKLTQQLAELGHRTIGLDPSMKMLQGVIRKNLPAVCGTAEAIPLSTATVDGVTAAQAFHWFDHARALPEMRRVLRNQGRVGLFWNLRDDRVEWVRALSDIMGSEDALTPMLKRKDSTEAFISTLTSDGLFEAVEHKIFDHEQHLTEEKLVGNVRSRSYIALLPDDQRDGILDEVRRLCHEHPQLAGRKNFTLPYKTRVFRAVAARNP